MKELSFAIILLSLFCFQVKADSEKEIKAPVKHVTVFPDRAQLIHETAVEIPAGKSVLKLGALSPFIDVQSVHVSGSGDFTILSVNQRNNYLQNLEDAPEVKSIRNQIEILQMKVEDEKAAMNVLKEREAFLVANRGILVKETTFTIDQLRNVMELYTNNMDQITMTNLKKTRLIKDYEKQIAALQKQLSDKIGKQQLPSGEISVTVSSERAVSGRLTYSYVVSHAGWYPSYDIRVDDIKKPVTILYKANVYQNTGTVWNDVKLSFSNATPWITGDVPALDPWFIDYYNPAPIIRRGKQAVSDRSQVPMMMEMSANEKKAEEKAVAAAPVPVEKQVGETTITFEIAVPYTIPSDGSTQTLEIQRITAPSDYRYMTTPKLSQLAYLTANITDWAKLSLQSGEATLYFENSFVGKSTLNVNQMKDTLAISLGTDNSILVKREKREDFTSRKVIGANKTETNSFLITLRNNKQVPVKITVSDQIPVSSNSGITVDPAELSGGKHNSATGEVKWDLDIKPQETKKLILTYSVRYPKDKNIILE
jgi:uncharacterized protein (TIGR02231 family)